MLDDRYENKKIFELYLHISYRDLVCMSAVRELDVLLVWRLVIHAFIGWQELRGAVPRLVGADRASVAVGPWPTPSLSSHHATLIRLLNERDWIKGLPS